MAEWVPESRAWALSCDSQREALTLMIGWMALRLLYLIFCQLLGWLVLLTRRSGTHNAELLVSRHEVTVLHRQVARRQMDWAHRAVLAALSRMLPRPIWRHGSCNLAGGLRAGFVKPGQLVPQARLRQAPGDLVGTWEGAVAFPRPAACWRLHLP
jgi:hypothetical protein